MHGGARRAPTHVLASCTQTIRSYWRNYFEKTDGLVWVVDSADVRRLMDCRAELDKLLEEEVRQRPASLLLARVRTEPLTPRRAVHRSWRALHCWCLPTNRTCRDRSQRRISPRWVLATDVVLWLVLMCTCGKVLNLGAVKNRHFRVEACSAVTGKGLLEGVDWIVNDIASRIFMLD